MSAQTLFWCREDASVPANVLPNSLVALTASVVSTLCCYSITVPTLPTALYTNTPSSALTVSIPTVSSGLTVTLRAWEFAGVNQSACTAANLASLEFINTSTLVFSPSETLTFGDGIQAQSFVMTATVSGCYAFTYEVGGVEASLFEVSPIKAGPDPKTKQSRHLSSLLMDTRCTSPVYSHPRMQRCSS